MKNNAAHVCCFCPIPSIGFCFPPLVKTPYHNEVRLRPRIYWGVSPVCFLSLLAPPSLVSVPFNQSCHSCAKVRRAIRGAETRPQLSRSCQWCWNRAAAVRELSVVLKPRHNCLSLSVVTQTLPRYSLSCPWCWFLAAAVLKWACPSKPSP